ncbi:MAG: class I SAM-dependent methyltransferase [Ktedonobacteraceae bacterium]|nr:class I SAM-dependent methyltransferase [Ktedonobacteraceae bacterium]
MSLMETEETNKFTFEPFASHAFYTDVNRMLVQQALAHLVARPMNARLTIVDMACGTGAITRLIAEEIARQDRLPQTRIVGIDPSAEALRLAASSIRALDLPVKADFIQGDGTDLQQHVQYADAVFFCNAIHLIPDKLNTFQQMGSILASGGIFACNSTFFQGCYVEGTERYYHLWTRRAMSWLRKEHPEVRVSREVKAMAMQWLAPEQYTEQLQQSGFRKVDAELNQVVMTPDAMRDAGQYWLFIEGALPGIPLALGAQALGVAAYQAADEMHLSEIPRRWLQLVAQKQ